MSDEQPRPRYGEYAPGFTPPAPPTSPAPPAPPTHEPFGSAPHPAPHPVAPRRWDRGLTIALLVLGLLGSYVGVSTGLGLNQPGFLDQALRQQGLGGFRGTAGAAPFVLVISHLALYLLALGLSLLALRRGRIAFWIPLTAGALAAVVFWAAFMAVLFSDPGLLQRVNG